MPFSAAEIRRAMTGKLGLEMDEGRRHPTFTFRHDGLVVARTHISHGGKSVSDSVVSAMARQLGITGPELRGSISCTISGERFSELVLASARDRS